MKKMFMILLILAAVILSACAKTAPKVCTLEYMPVCGADGVTYGNKCMAGKVEIVRNGECIKSNVSYNIEKVLDVACSKDIDCNTPVDYLVRSNCPYTSKCLDSKCTVVCPQFNGTKYPQVRDCPECPKLSTPSPDFCKDGKLVEGNVDECGCLGAPRCVTVDEPQLGVANPASKFCIDHGGELDIRTASDGSQTGYCIINQVECDEWALFRGECSNLHLCTQEEWDAKACTMEYMPVCGSDAQTYGNKCSACSGGIVYWTPGECVVQQ